MHIHVITRNSAVARLDLLGGQSGTPKARDARWIRGHAPPEVFEP